MRSVSSHGRLPCNTLLSSQGVSSVPRSLTLPIILPHLPRSCAFSRQPAEELRPEGDIAGPFGEAGRAPVRENVRREDANPSLADLIDHQQRIAAVGELREQRAAPLVDLVVAEEIGPFPGQPGEYLMLGDDLWIDTLRRLHAIVVRRDPD